MAKETVIHVLQMAANDLAAQYKILSDQITMDDERLREKRRELTRVGLQRAELETELQRQKGEREITLNECRS